MILNFNPQKRSNSNVIPIAEFEYSGNGQINNTGRVRLFPCLSAAAAVAFIVFLFISNTDTASSPTSTCDISNVPLDTSTFMIARDLWFSNETAATATYGHISTWDTAAVTRMNEGLRNHPSFNEDIGCWDTAAVTNMGSMFRWSPAFNQDIGSWNTAKVMSMAYMFEDSLYTGSVFNQDITGWDTGAVTKLNSMFQENDAFNQDIGGWNTAAVTYVDYMFNNAKAFNQDISSWDNSSLLTPTDMVDGSGMSCLNFKALRCAWSVAAGTLATTVSETPGNCTNAGDAC